MKNRILIITVLLVVVFAVALAPAIFLMLEGDHDCAGGDCFVCKAIAVCRNMLKSFICSAVFLAFAFAVRGLGGRLLKAFCFTADTTPVRLKVRMIN